jgi:hypothetical protein
MEFCSKQHDQVCFEESSCPACDQITDLREHISDLEKELDEANVKIKEYEYRE